MVVCPFNPNYLGGRGRKISSSKPDWTMEDSALKKKKKIQLVAGGSSS
jgi:hypothetical protein